METTYNNVDVLDRFLAQYQMIQHAHDDSFWNDQLYRLYLSLAHQILLQEPPDELVLLVARAHVQGDFNQMWMTRNVWLCAYDRFYPVDRAQQMVLMNAARAIHDMAFALVTRIHAQLHTALV